MWPAAGERGDNVIITVLLHGQLVVLGLKQLKLLVFSSAAPDLTKDVWTRVLLRGKRHTHVQMDERRGMEGVHLGPPDCPHRMPPPGRALGLLQLQSPWNYLSRTRLSGSSADLESCSDPRPSSCRYAARGRTETRNQPFDTNVWLVSCRETPAFTATGREITRRQVCLATSSSQETQENYMVYWQRLVQRNVHGGFCPVQTTWKQEVWAYGGEMYNHR